MITGSKIEKIVKTNASHVLYRKDGRWYHHLRKFPGVLFDVNGYILFEDENSYQNNAFLNHGKHLHVLEGISSMPGYQSFTKEEKNKIQNII